MSTILQFPMHRAARNMQRSPFVTDGCAIDFRELARLIDEAERAASGVLDNVIDLSAVRAARGVTEDTETDNAD